MSTPGRRKALRALAARKRANTRRVAEGKKPIIDGKQVSAKTLARHGGPGSKREAKRRLRQK